MSKLLIITGPTATGKTSLALEIAKKYDGEIISADSRQVYKYMDIGTGKDVSNSKFKVQNSKLGDLAMGYYEVDGVKIWGLDIVKPDRQFSVSDWVNYTNKIIKDIWRRGRLPVIVGGTGQYIKELLRPSETLHIPPNRELRIMNYELSELQNKLQEINLGKWEKMNYSDKNNPRRLVRAIEVSLFRHPGGSETTDRISKKILSPFGLQNDILIIGLSAPREFLNERIDRRVEQRIAAGMEKERDFLKKYRLPKTLGYNGEGAQEWKIAEHQYAKRQMDYLQKFLPETVWFDISVSDWQRNLWPVIQKFLNI
jgi:tRNA dimethylallyltransferase